MERAVVEMTSSSVGAWFWMLPRAALFTLIGVAFAVSEGDAGPVVVVGSLLLLYVLAWFGYMMLWPRMVSYRFDAETISAYRRGKLVTSVRVEDVEKAWPSWWQEYEPGIVMGMWPGLARFACELKDGGESVFPRLLLIDDDRRDVIAEIVDVTGLVFEDSVDGSRIRPSRN